MKPLFLLPLLLLVIACKKDTKQVTTDIKTYNNIEQLQWLVGNWTNITETEASYENWTKVNDSTLKAHSFTIIENDTVFAERVTLQQQEKQVLFTVSAYQQNDEKPVTFKLNSTKDGVFTFVNPEHDFPTQISYSHPAKDSIHAWIKGTVNEEPKTVDFYFRRAE
ncbi:DUF6265 family protein [Lacinutrix chionoecetis]